MYQPVNIEQRKLIDILIWVAQLGDNIQDTTDKVQKIQAKTAVPYRKINSRELESLLNEGAPKTIKMFNKKAFIYLPPIEKGGWLVPILSVEYNYAVETPELTLKVALFLISENDDKETLQAIGYRFETPHEQERHHYYHVQPIKGFERDNNRWNLPGTEWVPTDYPAFPMDAQDPIELLVCMLVSLYDLAIIKNLEGKFKTLIKSNIEKMKLYRSIT
jgi:hypothetical protein